MTISEAFTRIKTIRIVERAHPVLYTCIREIMDYYPDISVETVPTTSVEHEMGVVVLSAGTGLRPPYLSKEKASKLFFQLTEKASGIIHSDEVFYLYAFITFILEHLSSDSLDTVKHGRVFSPSFRWLRASYDYFLTQEGRIQRWLNRDSYVKEMARLGFTHIEINGLASPMGLESGPAGEIYPMFYTYCPALDQFVSSSLNSGLYPGYYLSANLEYLRYNAGLARRYGLVPGLLCFEPRSVPEEFFHRYPMLRGARVDHPFRSFKPRYAMTLTHPAVQQHYAELLRKIMAKVPELGFITIWSNDSGAGFEHTRSLYVGRNGGPYLIREWKDDAEIARTAGNNVIAFLRLLHNTGREINPDFRVITRLEPFYGEHETVWNGLKDGLEAETASLIAKGWSIPYSHPKYKDIKAINAGSIYQMDCSPEEKTHLAILKKRQSNAHFYFAPGPHTMFQPLIGIPYPFLTYRRLQILHNNGIDSLALMGGAFPPELVPYNINHEIVKQFQFNPGMDPEDAIRKMAMRWAGNEHCEELIQAWKRVEEAILSFPVITPLYATMGFTWYRLWARPFVPDIEAIPQEEREYYERFMCTTPHNPNNVDLSRDVLFTLTTPEKSAKDVMRIDNNVWNAIDPAIELLTSIKIKSEKVRPVITDQLVRIIALRCWFMTQRNVAAWISGIYGYMNARNKKEKERHRNSIREMTEMEIENSEVLIKILDSGIEFMTCTDKGETPLVYGTNLGKLLSKRIMLMREHMDDEPRIDMEYMFRKAGQLLK